MIFRERMNIYGGQKMALAKMKGIRRKKEVMIHGHGLREETTRTGAHTTTHQMKSATHMMIMMQ